VINVPLKHHSLQCPTQTNQRYIVIQKHSWTDYGNTIYALSSEANTTKLLRHVKKKKSFKKYRGYQKRHTDANGDRVYTLHAINSTH